ncbi:ABC transporter ATP-binding protein [Haloparvum alkalitolerans]|uniref:ABC transporter ATP-binding protein n=1 Tax=Haloparvum alkalitolerans TaxID=1042953 RepID=UPI003CEFB4DD
MAALELEALTKYYGDVRGIENVSLTVEEGEVFGFLGPNGAGKTTTIRTCMGFLSPTGGSVRVLGRDPTDEAEFLEARRRIGYLPSDPGLDPDRTGAAYLDLQADLKGETRRRELVDRFGLPAERRIGDLSRGNRQKVALVSAFMHDPELLVLDEPTAGLDPLLQEEFNALVEEAVADGATAFLSSHVLSEVQTLCDRVGIVRNGRLATVERVDDLLERAGKRVRVAVSGAGPRAGERTEGRVEDSLERLAGTHDVRVGEGTPTPVSFTYTGAYDDLVAWLAERPIANLDVRDAPLEDVFLRFYGEPDGEADEESAGTGSGDSAGVEA